jgi:5'-nucleotidase / UDP-sugar diphosphatase
MHRHLRWRAPFGGRGSLLRLLLLLLPLGAVAPAQGQSFQPELTVVQLNDVYRVDAVENGTAGGIGRVVTLARGLAQTDPAPVMVMHAGDAISPSLESQFFAGQQMIEALNHLHEVAPVLFVPGNHEFDDRRPATFLEAVRSSRFPWLAGNLEVTTGDPLVDGRFGRDTVIVAPSGMRIGVFTLTFLDSDRDYAREDTAYVAIAQRRIRQLERQGVHAIVGLTHLDLHLDREIAKLRRRHPRLLWIAGGHEHYLLREELTDSTALITKGDSNARRVWQVSLGRQGRRPVVHAEAVTLDAAIAIDPVYEREITQKWRARLAERIPFIDAVIGHSATLLDGSEETVRNQESAWGNWLTDRMRTVFPSIETDLAVLNGGAIRIDDVFSDTIRYEHLARTFGFPTRVGVVWIRGRDVRAMLEHSVSGGRGEGRFLQLSGLRVHFDRGRPEGERVLDVQVRRGTGWAPLNEAELYAVAVPDFLQEGGDGYTFHLRAERSLPPGPELRLVALDALASAYARGESIAPAVEGRLVEEGAPR